MTELSAEIRWEPCCCPPPQFAYRTTELQEQQPGAPDLPRSPGLLLVWTGEHCRTVRSGLKGRNRCPLYPQKRTLVTRVRMSLCAKSRHFRLWLRDCLMLSPGCRSPGASLCLALVKNLRLCSIVCAARHGLSRVMFLSKAWGKRRVSACASLHHCYWGWHSGRICTVVFLAHGGEWASFRSNALTCSTC